MSYFPVFLDLKNRPVLFVGNGPETEAKLRQLRQTGADLRVISPEPLPVMNQLAQAGQIVLHVRDFRESDVADVWLVISSSEDRALNARISAAAQRARIFCNIVDVTNLCSFISPAILRQGEVQVAISTGGASPALAQRLKAEIAGIFGPEYGVMADLLGGLRARVMQEIPDREERFALFHRMVQSEMLPLIRAGNVAAAKQIAENLVYQSLTRAEAVVPKAK